MNLNEMTIEQLKVLGFDQMAIYRQTEININLINGELQRRAESEITKAKEPVVGDKKPKK